MPTPSLTYPKINGAKHDFASIEASIPGFPFFAIKALNYSHKRDPGKVYGTSPQKLAETRGTYDPEGSLEIYLADAAAARAAIAALDPTKGFMEIRFPLVVMYADGDSPVIVDELIGVCIVGEDDSHSQGNEALTEKWTLSIMRIRKNGLDPLTGMKL